MYETPSGSTTESVFSNSARPTPLTKGCTAQWNDIFAAAQQGDTRLQRVLERYSRMISAKKRNDRMAEIVEEEVVSSPSYAYSA